MFRPYSLSNNHLSNSPSPGFSMTSDLRGPMCRTLLFIVDPSINPHKTPTFGHLLFPYFVFNQCPSSNPLYVKVTSETG